MADKTGIEWAGSVDEQTGQFLQGGTLNIGGGCTKVNQECLHCYAMAVTEGLKRKFEGIGNLPMAEKYSGLTQIKGSQGAQWTNKVVKFPERLEVPLRKTKGQAWFVSSLTDVFHDGFDDEYLDEVFGMFAVANWHKFYVLTKRAERQKEYLLSRKEPILKQAERWFERMPAQSKRFTMPQSWPLDNVWCGVTAGSQKSLEEFLPHLLDTPAVVQWLSIEPLIERIKLLETVERLKAEGYDVSRLLWAVIGGESGPYCRKMEPDWALEAMDDCRILGITRFFKQKGEVLAREWGLKDKKGADLAECPMEFRVREWPTQEDIAMARAW